MTIFDVAFVQPIFDACVEAMRMDNQPSMHYIEYQTDDGSMLKIEAVETNSVTRGPVKTIQNVVSSTLSDGIDQIKTVAHMVLAEINSISARPTEAEVEFGIRFTTDAGIVIAKTSTEAHVTIKLTWKKLEAQ